MLKGKSIPALTQFILINDAENGLIRKARMERKIAENYAHRVNESRIINSRNVAELRKRSKQKINYF